MATLTQQKSGIWTVMYYVTPQKRKSKSFWNRTEAEEFREEIEKTSPFNGGMSGKDRKIQPGRNCYVCGGKIVTDGEVYTCLNPECEADFVEVGE